MSKKKRVLTDIEKIKIKLAKKELTQYKNDMEYINEKMSDTEEIRSKLEKITTVLTPAKSFNGSASPDRFADGISKLDEIKNQMSSKMIKMLENKFRIDKNIDLLPDPYRDVLFYRYSRNMKWSEVADKTGYNERYVLGDLHGEALYLYSKIM